MTTYVITYSAALKGENQNKSIRGYLTAHCPWWESKKTMLEMAIDKMNGAVSDEYQTPIIERVYKL